MCIYYKKYGIQICKIFVKFFEEKSHMLTNNAFIWSKYSKDSNFVKYVFNLKIIVGKKTRFSAAIHYSRLQCRMIIQKSLYMLLKVHFILFSMLWY